MTLLATLGWLSLVLIIAFTWAAGRSLPSRRAALFEAWINIAVGFGVNYFINFLVLPLVGVSISASENWHLGLIYTLVSILRSYVIRLWCADRIHLMAARAAERLA